MTTEADLALVDHVEAELVDCTVPASPIVIALPTPPDGASPTQQAAEATIGQTGADPPPTEAR